MRWLLLLCPGLAGAADTDPVVDAVVAELARQQAELALPDSDPPYFIRAGLYRVRTAYVRASRGAVVTSSDRPWQYLGHEVRVGDTTLDNTNFGWARDIEGIGGVSLVVDLDPAAVRHDVWAHVESAYKDAVGALAVRRAVRRTHGGDGFPDAFTSAPVVREHIADEPRVEPDLAAMEAHARTLSAAFTGHPWVMGNVDLTHAVGRRWVVNTEGTRVSEPVRTYVVEVTAWTTTADGERNWRMMRFAGRQPDQVPALAQQLAQTEALVERLADWRELEAEEEAWLGPVLFEADGAVRLFNDLLVEALKGTPPVEREQGGYSDRSFSPLIPRRRVLPEGFAVVDDPRGDMTRPSAYHFDGEGVAGEVVELVRDGVLQTHLMSRMPNVHVQGSNGHGRADEDEPQLATAGQITVTADRVLSRRRLLKRAFGLAAQQGLDHIMVVRSVRRTGVRGEGNDSDLPTPSELVRLYADGREQPVRGLTWGTLDTRSLKEIVAAGDPHTRELSWNSVYRTITAPDVLLAEAELVPMPPAEQWVPMPGPPGSDGSE